MIERKYLRPALACLGSTIFFVTIAKLNSLEYPTLGRPIPTPTPQHILDPLPMWKNRCPDGSLPVVTKDNAFCRQSQPTPVSTPHQ